MKPDEGPFNESAAPKIIFFLRVSQSRSGVSCRWRWRGGAGRGEKGEEKKKVILHNQRAPSGTINQIPQNSEDQSYWLIKDPELYE